MRMPCHLPAPRAAMAALSALLAAAPTAFAADAPASPAPAVDVALVVSIDVSDSVDEARYRLQMAGIADALEDPGVIATILSGPTHAIAFSMVVWADKSEVAVPWQRIASRDEAVAVADRVRHLKRYGGEFTCLARMLRYLKDDFLASAPVAAARTVVDVSGDGVDNCSEDAVTKLERDRLVASGVTINGLPIVEEADRIATAGAYRSPGSPLGVLRPIEQHEQLTLEAWYSTYVAGGETSFVLPAHGYDDFARAMRQKFVTEIASGALPAGQAVVAQAVPVAR